MDLFAASGFSDASGWDILFLVSLVTVVPLLGTAAIYLLIILGYRMWSRYKKAARNYKES